MNTLALSPLSIRDSRIAGFFRSAFKGSTTLSLHAAAMLVGFAICLVLQFIDAREFNGANVWMKPGKFFISMAVHFVTIAWVMSLAEPAMLQKRAVRWSAWGLIISAWFELLYISFRAAQGEASHFNVATPLSGALYTLMGIGSVVLVVAAAVIGVVVWRSKPQALMPEAAALGMSLGALLTMVVGFTLGGNSGHWIGGDLTDVTGLPIFKWSTTGGDLRVSHFIGLHAMQMVPLAAVSGRRSIVWGAAIVITIATVLTFVQALGGTPLLRP